MNIVVDIGNTLVKYAFFEGEALTETGTGAEELLGRIRSLEKECVDVLVAATGKIPEQLEETLRQCSDSFYRASALLPLPLKMDYQTPETLGIDRLANAIAAVALFPGQVAMIVDAGTALTIDYVSVEGVYQGGNISPGMAMRFQALHAQTERLPLVKEFENHGDVGKNTIEAIRNGVLNGLIFEVRSYIDAFVREYPGGVVLLTGGDGESLKSQFREEVRMDKYLTMKGLNFFLEYLKTVNLEGVLR